MEGKWICYPSDYEMYLAEKVQTRRYQRDFPIAPFWRVDSPYHNVRFTYSFSLTHSNVLHIQSEGRISVAIAKPDPYTFVYGFDGTLALQTGEYTLEIWVYNPEGLPALKIDSEECITDEHWQVGFNQYMMVPCSVCDCGKYTPNTYHLPIRRIEPVSCLDCEGGKIYDFGKMIMAYPSFSEAESQPFRCYFGETLGEAMSDNDCEQIDFFTPERGEYISPVTKAFQYMRVCTNSDYRLIMWEEYDNTSIKFSYCAENKLDQTIADISLRTFSLCSREFYLDGIKRDRWIWSGDVYLGASIDYYVGYDCNKIKRTLTALLGKPPVVTYINHIMDYTSYAFITVWEYYEHSGDVQFLQRIYPILCEHMRFLLSRRNASGFLYKQENDWVHVDWNSELNTDGELCFEQILLYLALTSFVNICRVVGADGLGFAEIAENLKKEIYSVFWSEKRGAFLHARVDGVVGDSVTAYANIFAVLYNIVDDEKRRKIAQALLHDNSIPAITTPYMQVFLLSCLCELGEYSAVAQKLREYFGSMAQTGTSTFWETYALGEQKEQATEMYGRPFGRSQCHIWGAGALLIFGKYFFGLKNDINFGNKFVLMPQLSLIRDSHIELPLKNGKVYVSYYGNLLTVRAFGVSGELVLPDSTVPIPMDKTVSLHIMEHSHKSECIDSRSAAI